MAESVVTSTEEDYPAGERDAELVRRVLGGDREAMADMYDRYADRVHTMCVHMLHDDDEAADVTAQVLLVALQRLSQLREPRKLRAWLFAIARNEVYTRSKHRSRERPVEGVEDMSMLSLDPSGFQVAGPDVTEELHPVDSAALATLIQTAAGGLDERDRMVLELNLVQGLDGAELADALGVKTDNAYQLTHRMKERLGRSIGALLVVRAGRELCPDLDGVAKKWDGHYDVLWRKRFARHVDNCDRCGRMRSRLPKAVLAGAVLSQAAQSAVLAAPISVREQVLAQGPAALGGDTPRPRSDSGFPKARRRSRGWLIAVGAVLALLVVLGAAGSLDDGWRSGEMTTTTSRNTTPSTATSTSTTAVPTTTPPPTSEAPLSTTTAVRRSTTTFRPTTTAAPSTPSTTSTTTTSTTTTTTITEGTKTPPVEGDVPPVF
jgi:RNA polymerase sigma factor (sigma-70 family)